MNDVEMIYEASVENVIESDYEPKSDTKAAEDTMGEVLEAQEETDEMQYRGCPENAANEDGADDVTDPENMTEQIRELRSEIARLRTELELRSQETERLLCDFNEFAETFPTRSVASIPESVWESVRAGVPLAAAYALYEKKREDIKRRADEVNLRNARTSPGAVSGSGESGYYTPDEVRKMSSTEVRQKYNMIIESMKKWN